MKYFFTLLVFLGVIVSSIEPSAAQKPVEISTVLVSKDGDWFLVHKVARRESLEDIAEAYNTTIEEIVRYNSLKRTRLKVGSNLLIPKPKSKAELAAQMDSVRTEQLPEVEAIDTAQLSIFERFALEPMPKVGKIKPIGDTINIALLLPLDIGINTQGFVDFYYGVQLALGDIQGSVKNIALNVISTDKSEDLVRELVVNGALDGSDIIIGPVFPEEFEIVAQYAAVTKTPIISPLGSTGGADNAYVIEIAPLEDYKLAKLEDIFIDEMNNVVLIQHTTKGEPKALQELMEVLPERVAYVEYVDKTTRIQILEENLLPRPMNNIIVLPSNDEIAVEEILSRLSSMNRNGRYNFQIVGTSSWARFRTVNLELFHKLNVVYPTSYFFDRLSSRVGEVYREYVATYNKLPSLYSMRGYDVATIALYSLIDGNERVLYTMDNSEHMPLETLYKFKAQSDSTKIQNVEWPLVVHQRDFTINIE